MIYKIKEEFWSWGDDFSITDLEDNDCFYVKGIPFSWGNNLSFQDVDGIEIAHISQKMFNLSPKYAILIGGEPYAHLIKEFKWFGLSFTLDVPGPNDYSIDGSFWNHEFVFKKFDKIVAKVSKKAFSLTDSYSVDIIGEGYDVEILSACIIIDQIVYDGDKSNA